MRRKKLLTLMGSICLILVLAALPFMMACPAPTPPEEVTPTPPEEKPTPPPEGEEALVYHLKFQEPGAAAQLWVLEPFIKDVEAMSGGRIKISAYSGGEIVPIVDSLDAVASRVLDMASGGGLFWTGTMPVGGVESGLPFSWGSSEDVNVVFYERGLLDILREAYAERGVYYLGPLCADPYCMVANKEVRSLDDMRGLKVRATGLTAKALDAMGVATTYIPIEECYTALATGTIDGVVYGGADGYVELSYNEVAKFYYSTPIRDPLVLNIFINLDLWNSMPEDLQTILEVASREASRFARTSFIAKECEARKVWLEGGGVIIAFPDELLAQMRALAMPVWDEVAAESPRAAKAVQIVRDFYAK